jgi:hypothetical protein
LRRKFSLAFRALFFPAVFSETVTRPKPKTASFDAALVDFRLGPHERLRVLVVAFDEGIDVLLELLD